MHKQGVSTQAAVSWVVMPNVTLASQYKAMVDKRFSGNPPGDLMFSVDFAMPLARVARQSGLAKSYQRVRSLLTKRFCKQFHPHN